MEGRLVERSGERAGTVHVLRSPITTIGRGGENDIVVASTLVSRRHAQITWDGTQYVLTDLGSTNGTFVNARRVTERQVLRHGDVITIGDLTFLFAIDEATVPLRVELPTQSGLRVDLEKAEVWVDGRPVSLGPKEYLALALLYRRRGALVTKEELATQVWPEFQGAVSDYNIEQLISRLRRKLEHDPDHPRYVLTVRGLGYRLAAS
jgi:pSer/pThr/pTyr-binding forkhead associated (FHA) protein